MTYNPELTGERVNEVNEASPTNDQRERVNHERIVIHRGLRMLPISSCAMLSLNLVHNPAISGE